MSGTYDGPKHVIRTSDRGMFKSCRQKWDFGSFSRGRWRPLVTPRPLEFGTALHGAWDTYYDPDMWHVPRAQMLPLVQSRFLEICKEQKAQYLELRHDLPYELEEEFESRVQLGLGMLEHYVKWAPKVDQFTPVKVEVSFEVPIPDPNGEQMLCLCHGWPVFYQGRIDGIVKDHFGFYWILEHKTTALMASTEFLDLDDQCGSYAWALMQLGVPVKGVIYNEALKDYPEPPKPLVRTREGRNFSINRQQRTTYEVYLETIKAAGENIALYEEFLSYLRDNGNPFFRRTQVHRSDTELRNLGRRIYDEAYDMLHPDLRIYINPGRFTCQFCSYRQPCVSKQEGTDYEFILQELFVRGEAVEGSIDYDTSDA